MHLKKTTDAFNFEKSIFNYKYYRQVAFYSDLVEKLTGECPLFFLIALEDTAPFGVKFYKLDEELIDAGRDEIKHSLLKYKEWQEAGAAVKAYPNGFETVKMPGWFKNKYK
jgi:hypothetical protein